MGERALAVILKRCGVQAHIFDPDPHLMCVREGRREIGLWIKEMLALTDEQVSDIVEAFPDE